MGSVRQLTNANAQITLAQSYEPYGGVLSSTGTGSSTYAFTGEQYDSVTGLVYLRARYYAPGMGRFMNIDPSRQERNLYAYVSGNPVNMVDPSGLKGKMAWDKWRAQALHIYGVDISADDIVGSPYRPIANQALKAILANFDNPRANCDWESDVQHYVTQPKGENYNEYDWLFSGWADYWQWRAGEEGVTTLKTINANFLKAIAWRESAVGTENAKRITGFTTYLRRSLIKFDVADTWLQRHYDLTWGFYNFAGAWDQNQTSRWASEIGAATRWLYAANYNVNYNPNTKEGSYHDDGMTWMSVLNHKFAPKPLANTLNQYNPCYGYQVWSLYSTGQTYRGSSAATLDIGVTWNEIKTLYTAQGDFVNDEAEMMAADYASKVQEQLQSLSDEQLYNICQNSHQIVSNERKLTIWQYGIAP